MTQVFVAQDIPQTVGEQDVAYMKGTKRGELCIMDFFVEMAIEENAYQVRLGTKSSSVTGDAPLADQAAMMAVGATSGTTMIPAEAWITFDALGTDPAEVAIKSVGTAYTAASGTSFTPLNLCIGGKAAITTCEWQTAGGVVTPTEATTTTRQHFHYSVEYVKDDAAASAWRGNNLLNPRTQGDLGMRANPLVWTPVLVPVLKGVACLYLQVGGGTGPTHFAHIDYIELPTACVS